MEQSIIEFDKVQKKNKGSLRFVDIFLFPTGGTIGFLVDLLVQKHGSGRWLPKPSDTLK